MNTEIGLDAQRGAELLGKVNSLGALRRCLGAAVQLLGLSTPAQCSRDAQLLKGVMDRERALLSPLDAELVDRLLALIPPPDGSALLRLLSQLAKAGYPHVGSLVVRLQGLFAHNLQGLAPLSRQPALLLAAAEALLGDSFQLAEELPPPPLPDPLPPESVLKHGLELAQGLHALEVAQSSTVVRLGAFLTKVRAAVQHGEFMEAQEALGQAKELLRALDADVARARTAVAAKLNP